MATMPCNIVNMVAKGLKKEPKRGLNGSTLTSQIDSKAIFARKHQPIMTIPYSNHRLCEPDAGGPAAGGEALEIIARITDCRITD